MKTLITLFLIISSQMSIAQMKTVEEANKYIHFIDSLYLSDALQGYFYPNKSSCGGALYGYYHNDKLVCIRAENGTDCGQTYRYAILDDNANIVQVMYMEHVISYDGKFHLARNNTDTSYTFILCNKPEMTVKSGWRMVSQGSAINEPLLEDLIACSRKMISELESEKEPYDGSSRTLMVPR